MSYIKTYKNNTILGFTKLHISMYNIIKLDIITLFSNIKFEYI